MRLCFRHQLTKPSRIPIPEIFHLNNYLKHLIKLNVLIKVGWNDEQDGRRDRKRREIDVWLIIVCFCFSDAIHCVWSYFVVVVFWFYLFVFFHLFFMVSLYICVLTNLKFPLFPTITDESGKFIWFSSLNNRTKNTLKDKISIDCLFHCVSLSSPSLSFSLSLFLFVSKHTHTHTHAHTHTHTRTHTYGQKYACRKLKTKLLNLTIYIIYFAFHNFLYFFKSVFYNDNSVVDVITTETDAELCHTNKLFSSTSFSIFHTFS